VSDPSDLDFGKPWAAEGETRPSHFRTPLAHARGANGGVIFVRDGHGAERWLMLGEWSAWVKENHAAPVKLDPDEDPPWSDDPAPG
jgi:hypothetical protein